MAVGAFVEYNSFRRYIADGTIDVNSNTWKLGFYTSASNAATATLSTRTSVTNEVANGNGYTTGGKTLTGVVHSTGTSAGNRKLALVSTLSTAQFTVSQSNQLQIDLWTNGIFNLT
jgi:hypothetical protein